MQSRSSYRASIFCKVSFILFLGSMVLFAHPTYAQAQEDKSRLERVNKKKNKRNRNTNRRGDRAKSNTRQKRVIRSQTQSRQGDRAHEGDITGRPVRTKVSPRPSTANYAKPNPYAGKKRRSEASVAKAAARYGRKRPASATRTGERAFRTLPNGSKPRIRSATAASARARVYPRPAPYRRSVRTEDDMSRSAAKLRRRPVSATRKGEVARTTTASGRKIRPPRSISNRTSRVTPRPVSPYLGMKRRTEADMARTAAKLRRRPITGTTKGEIANSLTIDGRKIRPPRTVSDRPRTVTAPRVSPYFGKSRKTEDDMSREAARLRRRPSTGTRKGEQAVTVTPSGRRPIPRTSSNVPKTVTPPVDIYMGKKKAGEGVKAARNARNFSRPASISAQKTPPGKRKRIIPRTSSGTFRISKRKTPYGPSRRIRAWESAYTKDITGRRFRPKAPSTLPPPRPPAFSPYAHRKVRGDKPYSGNRSAFIAPPSLSRPTEKGWKGSISGGKIRQRTSPRPTTSPRQSFNPYYGRKRSGDQAYRGTISPNRRSASRSGESRPGQSFQGNRGRTMSITRQFKGPGAPAFDPYYGKRRKGTENPSPRTARNQSVTAKFKGPRGPLNPGRNQSITWRFKGPGQPSFDPYYGRRKIRTERPSPRTARNQSVTAKFKGPRGPLNPGRNQSITSQFKGPGQPTFDPYYGRRRIRTERPSPRTSNKNSITEKFKGPRGPLNPGRNISVTQQFKGPGMRTFDPYYGRKRGGDRPYSGRITPNRSSITRSSEEGAVRVPFVGSSSMSISNKYSGVAGKRIKGYRTTSTRWNNDGKPLVRKQPGKTALIASNFQGLTKTRRPETGGGSIARNNWNNKGKPIYVKEAGKNVALATSFSGNMKARKPVTGGGSVGRNNWNNNGEALLRTPQSKNTSIATGFSGTQRASPPLTGTGGSISRNNWNNKGDAIAVNKITPQIFDATRFKGRFKKSNLVPSLNDGYINYSGDEKVTRRPNRFYHPSYWMHNAKESDSVSEKDKKISIRLLWAKVFKSNNPARNRKRGNDLQFDPREEGLWYN